VENITLIHIGDIHYPDIDTEQRLLLLRDKSFPTKMSDTLPNSSYSVVINELIKEAQEDPLAILVSGDLTTEGGIDGYNACLQFLKERMAPFLYKESGEKLLIVPGNHDLDRDKVSESCLYDKFNPIKEAISRENFAELPISEAKFGLIKKGSSVVFILRLNSCVGCGDIRHYPEEIRSTIKELLERIKNETEKKLLDKLCNELDSPIFIENDIHNSIEFIKKHGDEHLPIILAHHNLLPQRVTRIEMYPEILNGGCLRDQLIRLNRPVLFLHGHTHDDPIEIIKSPFFENAKIICISAPLLLPNKKYNTKTIGFNKIRIFFRDELLVGCEITCYRLNGSWMDSSSVQRIRLLGKKDPSEYMTSFEEQIYSYIDSQRVSFKKIKKRYINDSSQEISYDDIEKAIEALDWFGFVNYKERNGPKGLRYVVKRVMI
jgi:Calcineurin-like phosphoesterase